MTVLQLYIESEHYGLVFQKVPQGFWQLQPEVKNIEPGYLALCPRLKSKLNI
jgi:hypothetical protein